MKKEREIVIDDKLVIGVISLIIGVINIALFFGGSIFSKGWGLLSLIFSILLFYISYKRLIKKKELTTRGWILFFVLLILTILSILFPFLFFQLFFT